MEKTEKNKEIEDNKFKKRSNVYLVVKYHERFEKLKLDMKRAVREILYKDDLMKRLFPQILVSFMKNKTLNEYLKPNYGVKKDIVAGNYKCGAAKCKTCIKMKGEKKYIQFEENGPKFAITGEFNCKELNCIYATKTPITNKWYIGSAVQFNVRENAKRSNLKRFDPARPNGCALIPYLYYLSKITKIDRMQLLERCETYIVDKIELSKVDLEMENQVWAKEEEKYKLDEKKLNLLKLNKNTLETTKTIDKKLAQKEIMWQLRAKAPWKGINDWRDINTTNGHRRGFSGEEKNVAVKRSLGQEESIIAEILSAIKMNKKQNDILGLKTDEIINEWKQEKNAEREEKEKMCNNEGNNTARERYRNILNMKKSNSDRVIKLFESNDITEEMKRLNKKELNKIMAELSGKQLDGILVEMKLARYGSVNIKSERIIKEINKLKSRSSKK